MHEIGAGETIVRQKSRMSAGPTDEAAEGTAYTFRPSVLGAPWEFRLAGDGLDWAVARKSGHIRFRDVRRLRLSLSARQHAVAPLHDRAMGATARPSWRSCPVPGKAWSSRSGWISPTRPSSPNCTGALRSPAPPARYEQGSNPLLYWPGLFVFAGLTLALAALIVRALQADAKAGAAFVGVFLLLLLWQGGNFFRRNRPGVYRPETPPAELLPKG